MEIVVRNQEGREGFRLRLEAKLKNAALVQARENLGLTQTEAAKRMGVPLHAYNGYETMRLYPTEDKRKKVCAFYTQNGQNLDERVVFPIEIAKTKFARKYVAERTIAPENLVALSEVKENMLPPADSGFDEMLERDEEKYRMKVIQESIENLPPHCREVLKAHYGFGCESKSLDEIAKERGVTRSAVSALIISSERRLRKIVRGVIELEKTGVSTFNPIKKDEIPVQKIEPVRKKRAENYYFRVGYI